MINYHALNKITIKNNYPLLWLDNIFDRLNDVSYFNHINLKIGYYQIHVEDADVEKMAMNIKYNIYEFLVMSFELCNAPVHFHNFDELDITREVKWVHDHLHKWLLSVLQVYIGICDTFRICVAKAQREQVVCQSGEERVHKSGNGLLGHVLS